MNPDRKEQLKRFVHDEALNRAVHAVLKQIFLKPPKNKDVQSLAAAWMAKDILEEAWKELLQLGKNEARNQKVEENIGL